MALATIRTGPSGSTQRAASKSCAPVGCSWLNCWLDDEAGRPPTVVVVIAVTVPWSFGSLAPRDAEVEEDSGRRTGMDNANNAKDTCMFEVQA